MTIIKELRLNVSIDIGLEEGEKLDVMSRCLDQSFSSPFALRTHPRLKRFERVNIIGYAIVTLYPINVISNQRVQGSSTFQSREKRLTQGTSRLSEKRRPRACQGTVDKCMRMHERRDRTDLGLGRGNFGAVARGMMMEEELAVEEPMSSRMRVEGSSRRYIAFRSHVSCFA